MRVALVDPSAFTPPYDHALAAALAAAGAEVELWTSAFGYGEVPPATGYRRREAFYRHAAGPVGSRRRLAAKLAEHVVDMGRLAGAARAFDVVHFQWLAVQPLDVHLLPRAPARVLTAHDVLPRQPRLGQRRAQRRLYERMDAVVVHTAAGRRRLVDHLGLEAARVHVIPHGALEHLTRIAQPRLPQELAGDEGPVVLFFGLLRPYKGLEVLLEAWRGITDARLWVVGRPRMAFEPLRAAAPAGVRFVPRFVADAEAAALFRRADLVVLPYLESEGSGVLFSALAFGAPLLLSDLGGFAEVAACGAAELVTPGDPVALRGALVRLLGDPGRRAGLAAAARAAAAGPYSWTTIARQTLALYGQLTPLGR